MTPLVREPLAPRCQEHVSSNGLPTCDDPVPMLISLRLTATGSSENLVEWSAIQILNCSDTHACENRSQQHPNDEQAGCDWFVCRIGIENALVPIEILSASILGMFRDDTGSILHTRARVVRLKDCR